MKNRSVRFQYDPQYAFERFIVAPINEAAYAAVLKVAESQENAYNPFCIYSGVGQGKTHLLKAIANRAIKTRKDILVIYMESFDFTNEVVETIRNNTEDALRAKYEQVDLFLMDDIQYLADKPKTQAELLHILNVLHEKKKQIVFACDRPLRNLQGFSPELKSIFEMGQSVGIEPPTIDTREAVLRKKAQMQNINLPPDVICWLAAKDDPNIRILEYYLIKIDAYIKLKGIDISLEMIKNEKIWNDILSVTV